jgi:hypothetical protein
LWEQLIALGNTLQVPELQSLKNTLISYQGGQYRATAEDQLPLSQPNLLPSGKDSIDFSLPVQANGKGLELRGSLSPFRLYDTYAIDLTLFSPKPINLEQLNQLNPHGLLLPPHIQASLGQTLLLYVEADNLQKDDRTIADTCVTQVFQNQGMPEFISESRILDSPIFEYDTVITDPAQQRHLLVWLNHNQLPSEIDEASMRLFYLLLTRHKILFAYNQSRWCDRQAKHIINDLEQNIIQRFNQIAQLQQYRQQNIIQRFNQIAQSRSYRRQFQTLFGQLLQMTSEYNRCLRHLFDHTATIQANLKNYQNQMDKLAHLPGNDLIFLQQFLDLTQNKFLQQIQVDRDYLISGQAFFNQVIDIAREISN